MQLKSLTTGLLEGLVFQTKQSTTAATAIRRCAPTDACWAEVIFDGLPLDGRLPWNWARAAKRPS